LFWDFSSTLRIPEKSLRSFPLLDPTMPSKGRFDRRWGLKVNISEDYLDNLIRISETMRAPSLVMGLHE